MSLVIILWISKRDGLNITMKIMPEIPVIDEKTKISFEIRKLNDSKFIEEDLNAKVTITDHDGRLFKFNNHYMPISNGKISVDYIFPDDGEHRIILQLYRNESAFALGYFNIVIPHPKNHLHLMAIFWIVYLKIFFRFHFRFYLNFDV